MTGEFLHVLFLNLESKGVDLDIALVGSWVTTRVEFVGVSWVSASQINLLE